MLKARLIGGAALAALAATITLIGFTIQPAAADTQIGWVLDASGSAQCVVKTGTNNHVVCTAYPAGGGAGHTVVDDWLPYACLGGAYMVAGNNAGTPAQIVYQNVTGYYCGRPGVSASTFRAGTCWNGSNWNEGAFSNLSGQQQAGVVYPNSSDGGTFPDFYTCNNVGDSNTGHFIYY